MESRVRKLQRDPRTAKDGRKPRRYRSDNRRMPYGEQFVIIDDVKENESRGDGVLLGMVGFKNETSGSRAHRCWQGKLLVMEVDVQVLQLEVCAGDGCANGVASGVAAGVAATSSASGGAFPRSHLDHGRLDTLGLFSL
ncbi:hypothetical protein Acr_00g0032190 [Actinidia rufa]|uniref:Uncharacterized protein n=1 Tax=Actinidia rufa TaxID=165716 RepID=A0A7J0DFC2_9ERIC|nr:hypothetical protein Acr_00g0032190 [Actinidia rufa]